MMNKWRDLIATQEDHGKSVEHTIKQNKIAHLRDRQMKAGFKTGKSHTLIEKNG